MDDTPVHSRAGDDGEEPLSPEQERLVRKVRFLAVLGAFIIFGGFALVFVAIIVRVSDPPEKNGGTAIPIAERRSATLPLRPGETVRHAVSSDAYLTVTISNEKSGATRILVLDLKTLNIVRDVSVVGTLD